jgi:acyl-coenzyme A thioesterase PaaI-like protein
VRAVHSDGAAHHPEAALIRTDSRAARPQLDWMTQTPSAPTSHALRHYQRLQRSLLGNWRFARAVRMRSPLLSALQPRFDELRVGLCRAELAAQRRIRQADGSLDPLALSALAQLAATMVIEVSVPETLSWSARGVTLEFLRRTELSVVATARLDKIDWGQTGLVGVPVSISDGAGGDIVAAGEVARAVVSFAVAMRSD